jgi:hypothetical protein
LGKTCIHNLATVWNEYFILSKVLALHLVTTRFEFVHQHVELITKHNKACLQMLPAASWGNVGSGVGY